MGLEGAWFFKSELGLGVVAEGEPPPSRWPDKRREEGISPVVVDDRTFEMFSLHRVRSSNRPWREGSGSRGAGEKFMM